MSTNPEETMAHYWSWCDQEQKQPAKVWGLRDETGKLIAWSTKKADVAAVLSNHERAKSGMKWALAVETRKVGAPS